RAHGRRPGGGFRRVRASEPRSAREDPAGALVRRRTAELTARAAYVPAAGSATAESWHALMRPTSGNSARLRYAAAAMKSSRAVVAMTVLVLLAGAARAPAAGAPVTQGGAQRETTPVFHRLVAFSLPAPFKVSFERTTGNIYVREHVPEGESVDEWSRLITLSGVQGMAYSPEATL